MKMDNKMITEQLTEATLRGVDDLDPLERLECIELMKNMLRVFNTYGVAVLLVHGLKCQVEMDLSYSLISNVHTEDSANILHTCASNLEEPVSEEDGPFKYSTDSEET